VYLMSILLLVLAVACLIVNLVHAFRKEKERRDRWLLSISCGITLLAVVVQFIMQAQQNQQSTRDLSAAEERHHQLNAQNQELLGEVRQLSQDNVAMSAKLAPVLKMARERTPDANEAEALAALVAEVSRMSPKLVFLEEKTEHEPVDQEQEEAVPRVRNLYHFRAQYPVALSDASVKLEFDGYILAGRVSLLGTLGFPDNLKMVIQEDRKSITCGALYMAAGSTMVIEIVSLVPLRVTACEMSP